MGSIYNDTAHKQRLIMKAGVALLTESRYVAQNVPVQGKFVYLVIKRRHWRHKTNHNRSLSNGYSF